jgi:hypothetical protein
VTTVADVWLPLAARLTAANPADNAVAPDLLPELPQALAVLLGDTSYQEEDVRQRCAAQDRTGRDPPRGVPASGRGGVEVRRVLHQLRSHAIENFNEQFKAISDAHGQVPTNGLRATKRHVLARSGRISSRSSCAPSRPTSASASSPSSRPLDSLPCQNYDQASPRWWLSPCRPR